MEQVTAKQLAAWIIAATDSNLATLNEVPQPWKTLVKDMVEAGYCDFYWWAERELEDV